MRKIFAILTALLLVSCSMNHDEVVVAMKATQSTKISKEQALKNLYSELKFIDEGIPVAESYTALESDDLTVIPSSALCTLSIAVP